MLIDHNPSNLGIVIDIWMISRVIVNGNHLDMAHMIFAVFLCGTITLSYKQIVFYIDICGFLEV